MLVNFTLYAKTPYTDALRLPSSDMEDFFDGKAFSDWKKARESESKLQVAVVERLNEVIRGTGIVAKTVARKRF